MSNEEQGVLFLGLFVIVYAIGYLRGVVSGRRDNLVVRLMRENIHSQHNRGWGGRLNMDACDFAVCKEARKIVLGMSGPVSFGKKARPPRVDSWENTITGVNSDCPHGNSRGRCSICNPDSCG